MHTALLGAKAVDHTDVRALNSFAKTAQLLSDLLTGSVGDSIHPVINPTIHHELQSYSIAGHVLVSGTHDVSYELLIFDADEFKGMVDDAVLAKMEWPLLIFRVPCAPIDSPLYHVLVLHEVGHALFNDKKVSAAVNSPAELSKASLGNKPDLVKLIELTKKKGIFDEAARHWVEELFADAVGLLLAGPSYLFAFCRVLGGFFDLEKGSDTHPPTALRIELMCALMKSNKLDTHLPQQTKAVLDDWAKRAAAAQLSAFQGTFESRGAALMPLLVREIRSAYANVVSEAEKILGARKCTEEMIKLDGQRGKLLHDFRIAPLEQELIPDPRQDAQALEPERIFGSCWFASFFALEQAPTKIDHTPSLADIGEILLGALDGAEAIRVWRRHK